MAFMEKLSKVANKVGEVAGDTFDYGKAKGKILLEKGKVSDAKGASGTYVYETRKDGGALDESRLAELCGEIDKHLEEIERLQAEAKKERRGHQRRIRRFRRRADCGGSRGCRGNRRNSSRSHRLKRIRRPRQRSKWIQKPGRSPLPLDEGRRQSQGRAYPYERLRR